MLLRGGKAELSSTMQPICVGPPRTLALANVSRRLPLCLKKILDGLWVRACGVADAPREFGCRGPWPADRPVHPVGHRIAHATIVDSDDAAGFDLARRQRRPGQRDAEAVRGRSEHEVVV